MLKMMNNGDYVCLLKKSLYGLRQELAVRTGTSDWTAYFKDSERSLLVQTHVLRVGQGKYSLLIAV